MAIQRYLALIECVDQLIRQKATGSPPQMAAKLGLSLRAWHYLRDELIEDLGFSIAYSRSRQTYYYEAQPPDLSALFPHLLAHPPRSLRNDNGV
jgi:hypothetical protein